MPMHHKRLESIVRAASHEGFDLDDFYIALLRRGLPKAEEQELALCVKNTKKVSEDTDFGRDDFLYALMSALGVEYLDVLSDYRLFLVNRFFDFIERRKLRSQLKVDRDWLRFSIPAIEEHTVFAHFITQWPKFPYVYEVIEDDTDAYDA